MKRFTKAIAHKAEGREAFKFEFKLELAGVTGLDRVLKGLDGSSMFVQASRGAKVVVSKRATAAGNAVTFDETLSFICTLYTSKKADTAFSEKSFRMGLMMAQDRRPPRELASAELNLATFATFEAAEKRFIGHELNLAPRGRKGGEAGPTLGLVVASTYLKELVVDEDEESISSYANVYRGSGASDAGSLSAGGEQDLRGFESFKAGGLSSLQRGGRDGDDESAAGSDDTEMSDADSVASEDLAGKAARLLAARRGEAGQAQVEGLQLQRTVLAGEVQALRGEGPDSPQGGTSYYMDKLEEAATERARLQAESLRYQKENDGLRRELKEAQAKEAAASTAAEAEAGGLRREKQQLERQLERATAAAAAEKARLEQQLRAAQAEAREARAEVLAASKGQALQLVSNGLHPV